MDTRIDSKQDLLDLLEHIAVADADSAARALEAACAPGACWKFYHPFNTVVSGQRAAQEFWNPLRQSFPNYEFRPNL